MNTTTDAEQPHEQDEQGQEQRQDLYNKQLDTFNKIQETIREPIYAYPVTKGRGRIRHAFDSIEIGLARARIVYLLRNVAGYDSVETLKEMPAFDSVEWAFSHPYVVDVYAEKHHPQSKEIILDRLVVDMTRDVHSSGAGSNIERGRPILLPNYDLPASMLGQFQPSERLLRRGLKKKKELICSNYDIPHDKYIQVNHLQLYNKPVQQSIARKPYKYPQESKNKALMEYRKSHRLLTDEEILVELLNVDRLQQLTP